MVGLLNLPIEILLAILEYVIHAEKEPPLEFSEDEQASRVRMVANKAMHGWYFGDFVYRHADRSAYYPNASNLLAVNQQLRSETKVVLESVPLVYKLDLAVMQGRSLWPTWKSIPAYKPTIDAVEVKIRTTGPGEPCVRILAGGDGGPPQWFWWFYTMLEHFFTIGVVPLETKNRVDRGAESLKHTEFAPQPGTRASREQRMAAQVLDLDFIDPLGPREDERTEVTVSSGENSGDDGGTSERACPHCKRNCNERLIRRRNAMRWETEKLHANLKSMFLTLLTPRLVHWGDILHRGIGIVRFRLNGHLDSEISLAEFLGHHWPQEQIKANAEWLKRTNATREAFGLEEIRVRHHARREHGKETVVTES